MDLHSDIDRVLVSEDVIQHRIDVLASKILEEIDTEGELVVVCLMKGAFVFTADLFRRLPVQLDIECMKVASYHGGTESSGTVKFLDSEPPVVKGKQVLLVDDILDTGRTLEAVVRVLKEGGAKSVKTCVLLSKEKQRAVEMEADYVGFSIGDEFVVGYGLDYNEKYRNLPYVGVLGKI